MDRELASHLTKRLTYEVHVDTKQLPVRNLSRRPVFLRWLDWAVGGEHVEKVRAIVRAALDSGELNAECRHIGLWKDSDVPVIVYSGSMAKQAREGMIQVFAGLDRAVLISTSAVEVGVDFHADVLITEECEGNSFLQRFGRVGRHGGGSKVIGLLSGDLFANMRELDGTVLPRERFSAKVSETFPRRSYAQTSDLVDASHYLINEQIGRIGKHLNTLPDMACVEPLAKQLRDTNIQVGYGLRSTMPQITLKDGVTKDPFYLLRYVDDDDLRPADSPFEVARTTTWFTSLIFQRAKFNIIVDLDETLKASQDLLVLAGNHLHTKSQPSIGFTYVQRMSAYIGQVGDWDKRQQGNFILLHGDVYLLRIDREILSQEPVRDSERNPLFIPAQTYLVLWGWTDINETQNLLQVAKVADWQELHYDWDRLKQDWGSQAMVILENTAGACFAAYKELVDYACRKV